MMTKPPNDPNLDHLFLAGFLAPKGSTDWCPSCAWDGRCARCRAWQD